MTLSEEHWLVHTGKVWEVPAPTELLGHVLKPLRR